MREPYTDDWVCRLHNRRGSHADEATCPAYLFTPVEETQPIDPDVAAAVEVPARAKRYRKRPEPPEVTAVAVGALMLVQTGQGPEYPVPRDQFFATYEEIPEDREDVEAALDRAETDVRLQEAGVNDLFDDATTKTEE